ncbi:hypothetical protein [Actibacterium sp. D379-3]
MPAELVQPFPFIFGMTTDKDPFTDLAKSVHAGPEIFYAPHAYPGATPAWVLRRAEDLKKVYFDTEHFSNKGFSPFARLIGETWGSVPAETDPPLHALYRAFVNPIFTPQGDDRAGRQDSRLCPQICSGLQGCRRMRIHGRFRLRIPNQGVHGTDGPAAGPHCRIPGMGNRPAAQQ